jgi:hypothetical protein
MTEDQRNAINELLACGSVLEALAGKSESAPIRRRAAKWREALAVWEHVRGQVQCHSIDCENQADSGGRFCTECWRAMGPYDRPIGDT